MLQPHRRCLGTVRNFVSDNPQPAKSTAKGTVPFSLTRKLGQSRCLLQSAAFVLVAAIATCAPGQEWSGNGQGYTPMAPATGASSDPGSRSAVPQPPVQPPVSSRPAAWPGGPAPAPSTATPQAGALAPLGKITPCDGTRIIARVGSEAIFEGDLAGTVNGLIEAHKSEIPPSQLDAQREMLMKKLLDSAIEAKLVYQDAKRAIPTEALSNVEKQLVKQFDEVELERKMKLAGVATVHEYDLKLRSLGTSLERERRAFIEQTLAHEWIRQQVKRDGDPPTYDQMVAYYHRHQDEFTTPARVQWEELMARYPSSKYPTRDAAHDAVAQMGNQILAGKPFAEAARAGSDGATAADGGVRAWTSQGSLAAEELDRALFTLPVGQMSPIIATQNGFHIVRVTAREDAFVTPFLEAQVEIKDKIEKERSQRQFREYMAKLQTRTPVWTVFENQSGQLQLSNRFQEAVRR